MIKDLNYAYGKPLSTGRIKLSPDDFFVEEHLSFEPSGEGEHLFLFIEKKLLNTEEVAVRLGKFFNIQTKLISYAGMKDKFAQTRQWFSVHFPGKKDISLEGLESENLHILNAIHHNKKLKIGALKENHFKIKISDIAFEKALLERIKRIALSGVPNYFGRQRFGNNGSNLFKAKEVLLQNKCIKNPHLRGIYYSAARSFLFNEILSLRVKSSCWNLPVQGDLMMLSGTHSFFKMEAIDESLMERTRSHDISPGAPLWGDGKELVTDRALELQNQALEPWQDWCTALSKNRLNKLYRPLVVVPQAMECVDNTISFTLPAGSFATSVLRELVVTEED